MASLFTSPTYITRTELEDSTNVAGLKAASDADQDRYIVEAENAIDSYVGFIRRYDTNQARKFPTIKDGAAFIPTEIKQACVYIAESMYLMGVPTTAATGEIKSEKVGDHSIEYVTGQDVNFDIIPAKAKALLDVYRNVFFGNETVYGGGTYLEPND